MHELLARNERRERYVRLAWREWQPRTKRQRWITRPSGRSRRRWPPWITGKNWPSSKYIIVDLILWGLIEQLKTLLWKRLGPDYITGSRNNLPCGHLHSRRSSVRHHSHIKGCADRSVYLYVYPSIFLSVQLSVAKCDTFLKSVSFMGISVSAHVHPTLFDFDTNTIFVH